MFEPPNLLSPLTTVSSSSQNIFSSTWQLIQGCLWPLIEENLWIEEDQYRELGSFEVAVLGKIIVSTQTEQDEVILKYPRYSDKINGGYGWDTFARTCFGWENLIMAQGKQHATLLRILGPLFSKTAVKNRYYSDLIATTENTVASWDKNEITLLDASLEHSCRSVTTCFLGKEAAKSQEIVEAVQNLMGVFWDNAQMKPLAIIYHISRKIFGQCCGDPDGYWQSHTVLEEAIEEASLCAPKDSFIGCLLEQKMTPQEIIDNMKMLYFAGTETTGSLITTILGHLAINPFEQKNLLIELHKVGVNTLEDLDYETLLNLDRLHAVLYEALRLVPPIPIQVREVNTDIENYSYFIDHYHRLRDKNRVGPNPDKFYPDRFLYNGKLIKDKDVEKTFGGGSTPCIGKNFALTETLLLTAAAILRGPFELTEGDPTEIIREAGAHLSPNLKIRFI